MTRVVACQQLLYGLVSSLTLEVFQLRVHNKLAISL